jgi:hypothetical protein
MLLKHHQLTNEKENCGKTEETDALSSTNQHGITVPDDESVDQKPYSVTSKIQPYCILTCQTQQQLSYSEPDMTR